MKILSSFTQPQLKDTSKSPYNESQWGPKHNIAAVEVNFEFCGQAEGHSCAGTFISVIKLHSRFNECRVLYTQAWVY